MGDVCQSLYFDIAVFMITAKAQMSLIDLAFTSALRRDQVRRPACGSHDSKIGGWAGIVNHVSDYLILVTEEAKI